MCAVNKLLWGTEHRTVFFKLTMMNNKHIWIALRLFDRVYVNLLYRSSMKNILMEREREILFWYRATQEWQVTHTNITSQSFVTCVFKSFVFCYYSCLFCNAYLYLSKFRESEYHYYMKRKFCHIIFNCECMGEFQESQGGGVKFKQRNIWKWKMASIFGTSFRF